MSCLHISVWPDLPPACARLLYATEKRTRLILEVLYNRPRYSHSESLKALRARLHRHTRSRSHMDPR